MYGIYHLGFFPGGQKCQEAGESGSAEESDARTDGGLFPFRKTVKYPPLRKVSRKKAKM